MNHMKASLLSFIFPQCQYFYFSTKPKFPEPDPLGTYLIPRGAVKPDTSLLNPRRDKACLKKASHQEVHTPKIQVTDIQSGYIQFRLHPSPPIYVTRRCTVQKLRPLNSNSFSGQRGLRPAAPSGLASVIRKQQVSLLQKYLKACFTQVFRVSDPKHCASLSREDISIVIRISAVSHPLLPYAEPWCWHLLQTQLCTSKYTLGHSFLLPICAAPHTPGTVLRQPGGLLGQPAKSLQDREEQCRQLSWHPMEDANDSVGPESSIQT